MRWLDYALGMLGFYTANVANSLETGDRVRALSGALPARHDHDRAWCSGVATDALASHDVGAVRSSGRPTHSPQYWSAHGAEKQDVLIRALAHVPSAVF